MTSIEQLLCGHTEADRSGCVARYRFGIVPPEHLANLRSEGEGIEGLGDDALDAELQELSPVGTLNLRS